jgi:hypothetical protein
MRKILLATLLACSVSQAHATDLTGEALALACAENVPGMASKDKKKSEQYAEFCNSYINGWDDARYYFRKGTRTYCPPRITAKELSVVFFDFLASHKEVRQIPAAEALYIAFSERFPCPP